MCRVPLTYEAVAEAFDLPYVPVAKSAGLVGTMAAISVDDAIAGYIDHVSVERGLSANTVAAYKRDLARYSRWCRSIEIALVEEVESQDVARSLRPCEIRKPTAWPRVDLSASSAARRSSRCVPP